MVRTRFSALSDPANCIDVIWQEPFLIAIQAEKVFPESDRKAWGNILAVRIIIGILNQFEEEMGIFCVKLLRKSVIGAVSKALAVLQPEGMSSQA